MERRRDVLTLVEVQQAEEARWLALTIRQGLLLICKAIEKRYGLGEQKGRQ